jgi:hypothetical protein
LKRMEDEIALRIQLLKPTPGADFGLQKGSGSNYETVQTQRSTGDDLTFELTARVKQNKNSEPNFLGEFVQGPPAVRFIYIDIGTCAGQKNTGWSRRLKIPLSGITAETLQEITSDRSLILETKVQGTGKDGGPSCGTIKPFDGWYVVKR